MQNYRKMTDILFITDTTRSSATAERQRVSYARFSRSLTDRALH